MTYAEVQRRLEDIEADLQKREVALEDAARKWFIAKRDREKARAVAFLSAEGTIAERSAKADLETTVVGKEAEAEFEALRAVVRVLETRASIGQSLLRSMTREAGPQPQWSTA